MSPQRQVRPRFWSRLGSRLCAAVGAAVLWPIAAWAACSAGVHGHSDAFATPSVAVVWAVLRGSDEQNTRVVWRLGARQAQFTHVGIDGVDPFGPTRRTVSAAVALRPDTNFANTAWVDVDAPRGHFSEFPRTELLFTHPAGQPPLCVYYLGVPDTVPEFNTLAELQASLALRIAKLLAQP